MCVCTRHRNRVRERMQEFVRYLHITLVCVHPVKQRFWSHPFYRETALRRHVHTNTLEVKDNTHTHKTPI